jgi:hypothetical protein
MTTTDTPAAARKIAVGDIKIGDRVGKTRTGLHDVTAIEPHPKMIRLTFANGETAQPAKTTAWWIAEGDSAAPTARKAKSTRGRKVAAAEASTATKTAPATDGPVDRLAQLRGLADLGALTFPAAAEKVLREAVGPMKVAAIAELAVPLTRTQGKTPAATLGARLITDANKGGTFIKVAPGTFDVRELNPRGAAKRPKAKS